MHLIPLNATTHYKAAFSISNGEDLTTKVRKEIRKWCAEKFGDRSAWGGGWFFTGSKDQLRVGLATVRVASNKGEYSLESPADWAIEIIHVDSKHRERYWSIEIGISRNSGHQARFAISTKYWIKEGYFGSAPPEPLSTTPKVVKNILRLNRVTCKRGTSEVHASHKYIDKGQGKGLYEEIVSESRMIPIVIVAPQPEDGKYPLNGKLLWGKVAANANVYSVKNQEALTELNYFLGNSLTCLPGSVRVYLQKTKPLSESDARRHRYFSRSYISAVGGKEIDSQLVHALSRNARVFKPNEIVTIRNVQEQRRIWRLKELLENRKEDSENNELMELLLEENGELSESNRELRAREGGLLSSLQDKEDELATLSYEKSETAKQVLALSRANERLSKRNNPFEHFSAFPNSLGALARNAALAWPDRILVLPQAINAAESYVFPTNQYEKAWLLIKGVAKELHSLVFKDGTNELETPFKEATGFSLAMSEGKQTQKDAKLMKLRKVWHEGKEYDITPHVK